MDLTNEQRQAVRQWVTEGASLYDVQKRLKTEFGLGMTYMDVRFLVLDLGAKVKDKPEPRKVVPPPADEDALADDDELAARADGGVMPSGQPAGQAVGSVSVTMDRVVRAGAVASGSVTFSDGATAKWLLDQMGRLGLDGAKPGYRPPAQDVQDFQNQLRTLLQSRGY